MDPEIRRERSGHLGQYLLVAGDEVIGELDHRDQGEIRTFTHTGVRGSHRGQGLAAQLVRRALDDARTEGMRIVPQCWYVAQYLDQHPADADLVAAG